MIISIRWARCAQHFLSFLFLAVVAFDFCGRQTAAAAQYQWDFGGNLNTTFGNGVLSYSDESSQTLTTFGTTNGGTVPHINGQPATYMYVPAFTDFAQGYNAEFNDSVANGGGLYINQYTMIYDVLVPGPLDWTPFFNADPENSYENDADFYIASDGSLGIAELGYSAENVVLPDTWNRIAFTADLAANEAIYYVNGVPVFHHTGGDLLDKRYALYSSGDPGADLRLFNEGDPSGDYTHELYVNSFYFADRTLSASEILALGGATAAGIVSSGSLDGDFDHNGKVDAADYVIWRNNGGSPSDYALWRSHFGQSGGSGSAAGTSSQSVPEPTSVVMAFLSLPGLCALIRRR